MPAPIIYRSTDPSAPVLSGTVGALVALLDACLVNGYTGKSAAGWTKPYTSTNAAVFRQGSGSSGRYLQVDDSGTPWAGGARDAVHWGFETMTAYNVGTGQFPTTTQVPSPFNANAIRKSQTADAVVRPWMLFADAATFYLFVLSGDQAGVYAGTGFGDIYSYIAADAYKCAVIAGFTSSTLAQSGSPFGQCGMGVLTSTQFPGHWLPRNFAQLGGATNFYKFGDTALIPISSSSNQNLTGNIYFPNQLDGGLYLAPIRVMDGSTPGIAPFGNVNLRGQLRGLWHLVHPTTSFADGDTFSGAAGTAFAGRTFLIVKPILGTTAASVMIVETTAWDTSS